MLAVIVEKIVTTLAEPRAGAQHDIASASLIGSRGDVNGPISDEVAE
jgi:hypothetical protein